MSIASLRVVLILAGFVIAGSSLAQTVCSSGALRPYDGAPVNGAPIAIAGAGSTVFEVENFDCGGEDIAYHDNVAGNSGGQYRTAEDPDIIVSSDPAGGGYVVNTFETGEWLKYTINVQSADQRLVQRGQEERLLRHQRSGRRRHAGRHARHAGQRAGRPLRQQMADAAA